MILNEPSIRNSKVWKRLEDVERTHFFSHDDEEAEYKDKRVIQEAIRFAVGKHFNDKHLLFDVIKVGFNMNRIELTIHFSFGFHMYLSMGKSFMSDETERITTGHTIRREFAYDLDGYEGETIAERLDKILCDINKDLSAVNAFYQFLLDCVADEHMEVSQNE